MTSLLSHTAFSCSAHSFRRSFIICACSTMMVSLMSATAATHIDDIIGRVPPIERPLMCNVGQV